MLGDVGQHFEGLHGVLLRRASGEGFLYAVPRRSLACKSCRKVRASRSFVLRPRAFFVALGAVLWV